MPVRHVVMWSLKQACDAPRFRELLLSCADCVPGVLSFEVGVRDEASQGNVDVVLVSTFVDDAALQAYQQHPRHLAVSAALGPLRVTRQVLDYAVATGPAGAPA